MDTEADFASMLRTFMARAARGTSDLARLTDISLNTLESWSGGRVRRPRFVADVLKLARALALDAADTTALLAAAHHPPLATLQAQARQTADVDLAALLAPWETAAPAPPTPSVAPRYQLRAPVADFVGRANETAQLVMGLQSALAEGQGAIISGVQGMGGVGKTELAYHVAHQLRETFADAQIVVVLGGSSATPLTPKQALQAVIYAFTPEARLPDELPALERHYRTVLHGQRALILADDARDAVQVRSLLPPSGSALLITSRQRFTLPAMATIDLDQLPTEAACRLLRRICVRLTADEAAALARACGFLPLALRVAGGLLRSTPALAVADYLAKLADARQRLPHLRDPDDGQLDVAAALDLSYAQLTPAAQVVFRQLGVIGADFAADLALAVVAAPPSVDVAEELRHLLRRNMVIYDAARARWRLHDLLRDLARQHLDAQGETEVALWRYARAAVQIAQATQDQYVAGGDGALAALARFDAERPHIDAARVWAEAHAGTPDGDRLLWDAAAATRHIGQLRYDARHERLPHWEGAHAAAQRLGDRRAERLALTNLGIAHSNLGETRHAFPYYEQALAIARMIGDRRGEGIILNNLGLAYNNLGQPQRAIPYFEQAIAIAQAIGGRHDEEMVLTNLGIAYVELGETRRAIPYFEQALTIACAISDRRFEWISLTDLGLAYSELGETRRAIPYFEQALTIAYATGDRFGEGEIMDSLGNVYTDLGDSRRAIECCEMSLSIAREIGDRRLEGWSLSHLARAQVYQGDTARATSTFAQAVALLDEIGDQRGEAEGKWQFGLALAQQGERAQVLPLLRAALAYQQEIGHAKAAEHATLVARLEAGEDLPAGPRPPTEQREVEAGWGTADNGAQV
jgi:tetratricopeptide (TPR) repeat protein